VLKKLKMRKEYRRPVILVLYLVFILALVRLILYAFSIKGDVLPGEIRVAVALLVVIYVVYEIYKIIWEYLEKNTFISTLSADKLSQSEEMLSIAQKIAKIGYWEEYFVTGEINFTEELYNILDLDHNSPEINKKVQLAKLHSSGGNAYESRKKDLFVSGEIEFEYRFITCRGYDKFLFERVMLVKKENMPYKLVGIIQDITERKNIEQKTFQSEKYYKSLFDGAKDALIIFYPATGIVIDVNPQACIMYGLSKEEFIGLSLLDMMKSPETGRERIAHVVTFRQSSNFKSVHIRKDRSELFVELTASVIDYFGEEVILTINRDITETHLAEERIRLLSLGIEQHPSPIVITDIKGNIEYVNRAFEEITGYTFEEVKGKNPRILQSGDTKRDVYDGLWNTLLQGKEWRGEFRNRKKDGTLYWEMAVIYPMVDSDNNIKQYFASKTDITERKELEFQLKTYRERLEFLVDERTKRLKESEETFRALSENSNDVIMRFNRNIEHIYVNPAAEKLFNIPSIEFIGKGYSKLRFTEDVYKKWEESIKKVFETKAENTIELCLPNGRWFDCRLYPEYSNDGEIVSVITSSRDITDMKLTENDLYKKERLLRGVAEASNKLLSLDSFYNRINKALEIMGRAAEIDRVYIFENSRDPKNKELLMTQIYEWASPAVSAQINNLTLSNLSYKKAGMDTSLEVLSAGRPFSMRVKDIPPAARKIYEEQDIKSLLIMPIEIGGIFWGFVGFDECKFEREWEESEISILKILASDIGGAFTRKLIEDALMNTEERFKALFDYAPMAYFIIDTEGSFIDVNNSFEKTIGYSKKEIAEKKRIQSFVRNNEDKVLLEKLLEENKKESIPAPVELNLFAKSGRKIVIELSTFPITLAEKNMILCAVHDVSLRKETENEIRTALSHSQELNEIKSRFVSMVSHEFRTPLSTILSSVEILRLFEERLKEEDKENHFRKISKSIDYLTNLLDDVITINRADSGRLVLKFKVVDVIPLIEQWIQDLKVSYTETPEIIFEKDSGPIKVEVDENQLRQITTNLMNNAIKYTPPQKKITITAQIQGTQFVFRIADQGIGIPAEAKKEIFNPFFRAINTGNVPGSGLGLAVTKRSVESLNGTISFESRINMGTTFTVIIPLKRSNDEKNSTN